MFAAGLSLSCGKLWKTDPSLRRGNLEFDPADAEAVAGAQDCASHALAVDERAVRTAQILDDELIGSIGSEPAVKPRHESRVDDEVSSRGSTERLDASNG
jgi:hypothetical protein